MAEVVDPEVVTLVERAQDGDRHAFADLYDRYVDKIYGYVLRRVQHKQTAEDLTSDVFLRAFDQLGSFEWQGKDLAAWLTTIARNRVHDHFKSARFRFEKPVDRTREDEDVRVGDHPERVTEGRALARALGEALEQLSDDHREVLELRFVHGMSVAQTAEVMERTHGACKALQYRALQALKTEVDDVPGLSDLAAFGVTGLLAALRMLPL